jgi:hypothetical protein
MQRLATRPQKYGLHPADGMHPADGLDPADGPEADTEEGSSSEDGSIADYTDVDEEQGRVGKVRWL